MTIDNSNLVRLFLRLYFREHKCADKEVMYHNTTITFALE